MPLGGIASAVLANVALHDLEEELVGMLPKSSKPGVIRYADDFVILHEDLETLKWLKWGAEAWPLKVGLRLRPSKTRITHTLHEHEGKVGFDFLGFTLGQYRKRSYRRKPGFKTLITPRRPNLALNTSAT